jgi:leucyl-tRNA synthetase
MFERGIAYRSKTLSNWCPVDQTVLANEHVEAGKCWRCGTEVVQKEVEQWFLKITEYADRLLWPEDGGQKAEGRGQKADVSSDLGSLSSEHVDWPKSVMEGQNNWIGKSEGAVINFSVDDLDCHIKVFTTRPDTLYGATCVILAPEHELVKQILKSEDRGQRSEIKKYIDEASKKSELERKEMKEKTGVFTGVYAINPVNKEKIPVWVADYVLTGYGTGAIMAVPASDARDFEFAQKFDLPIKFVIKPLTDKKEDRDKPYVGPGILINSGEWQGMRKLLVQLE